MKALYECSLCLTIKGDKESGLSETESMPVLIKKSAISGKSEGA